MREPNTPADRVRWAISHAQITLPELADQIGCSHSALSQWQTGETIIENVKAGLLFRFCERTGVSMRRLLTGDGPRVVAYPRRSEPPLLAAAAHIVNDLSPDTAALAERLLRALEPSAESH